MENNQIIYSAPQEQTQIPSKTHWPKIMGFTVFGLGIAAGLVFIGMQIGKREIVTTQPTPTSTTNTTSTSLEPSPSSLPTLPAGWEYKHSQQQNNANSCVTFALPPMVEPYVYTLDESREPSVSQDKGSGRFWYLGGGAYPNLLSKLMSDGQEYQQTMAIFATETEASGYISQAVVVSCIPNNNQYTDNAALITALSAKLDTYNGSTDEKGMQAATYEIKTNAPATRWGKSVSDLTVIEDANRVDFAETKYTLFVTPEYIYEVKTTGGSNDSFVKETAQKIFNNLNFD